MNKPTVDELEAILDGRVEIDIEILPSGEIVERTVGAFEEVKQIKQNVSSDYY